MQPHIMFWCYQYMYFYQRIVAQRNMRIQVDRVGLTDPYYSILPKILQVYGRVENIGIEKESNWSGQTEIELKIEKCHR